MAIELLEEPSQEIQFIVSFLTWLLFDVWDLRNKRDELRLFFPKNQNQNLSKYSL